ISTVFAAMAFAPPSQCSLSFDLSMVQCLGDGGANAMAAKPVEMRLNCGDELRVREGEFPEERPDGKGNARITAACVEKGLHPFERRIGDGKRTPVLIVA